MYRQRRLRIMTTGRAPFGARNAIPLKGYPTSNYVDSRYYSRLVYYIYVYTRKYVEECVNAPSDPYEIGG